MMSIDIVVKGPENLFSKTGFYYDLKHIFLHATYAFILEPV